MVIYKVLFCMLENINNKNLKSSVFKARGRGGEEARGRQGEGAIRATRRVGDGAM
jgi:hypothetical protein